MKRVTTTIVMIVVVKAACVKGIAAVVDKSLTLTTKWVLPVETVPDDAAEAAKQKMVLA